VPKSTLAQNDRRSTLNSNTATARIDCVVMLDLPVFDAPIGIVPIDVEIGGAALLALSR
jgi:hypothetical protein